MAKSLRSRRFSAAAAARRPQPATGPRTAASAPPGTPALDPTLEFLRLIWALDHNLHVASKRMASSFGITGPQRLVVRLIGRHPQISAGELARVLHVHKSTITGVVQRLEARGLVRRTTDARDARRLQLALTEAGRRVAGPVPGTVESAVKRVLGSIDQRRLDATRAVLERLASELGQTR
jgi:DNA-binding MarR family transcriptional regulator